MAYDWSASRAPDAFTKNYSATHPFVSETDFGAAVSGLNHNLAKKTNSLLHSIKYKGMTINLNFTQRGLTPTDLARLGYASLMRYVTVLANRMVEVARCITPEFKYDGSNPNSLSNSIRYILGTTRNQATFTIGVDADNWKSDYDEAFKEAYHTNVIPWGSMADKNLLLYRLHEWWGESFPKESENSRVATKMGTLPAIERAREKTSAMSSNAYGMPVGGKFLYRAVQAVWTKDAHRDSLQKVVFSSMFKEELGTSVLGTFGNFGMFSGKDAFKPETLTNVISHIHLKDWL